MRKIPCEDCLTLSMCKNRFVITNVKTHIKEKDLINFCCWFQEWYNDLRSFQVSRIRTIRKTFSSGEKYLWIL